MLAVTMLLATPAAASPFTTSSSVRKLPLMPLPLDRVPLVGETATLPRPHAALLDEIHGSSDGCFGLLLRTSQDQAVSWTPLLQLQPESTPSEGVSVRCIGRAGISRMMVERCGRSGVQLDCALAEPYCDVPLPDDAVTTLDESLVELEALYQRFSERQRRVATLRGLTSDDLGTAASEVDGEQTLGARARQRARDLDECTLLSAAEASPDVTVRQLITFAAFDREVATWKTRLAAMQCADCDARVALAMRAMHWTIRRLDAEISLRAFEGGA